MWSVVLYAITSLVFSKATALLYTLSNSGETTTRSQCTCNFFDIVNDQYEGVYSNHYAVKKSTRNVHRHQVRFAQENWRVGTDALGAGRSCEILKAFYLTRMKVKGAQMFSVPGGVGHDHA